MHVITVIIMHIGFFITFIEFLRDFSKSSRSGELAQGINYYLSLSELGAYCIWDYKQFVKDKLGSKTKLKGRLPDYVLEYRDGTYGILEVKGTNKKNPTDALLKAKKQYENGKIILNSNGINVRDTYASAVSFATTSKKMDRYTTIYLVDPVDDEQIDDKMNFKAGIMRECSKHLCLAGNVELANKFKKGNYSTSNNEEDEKILDNIKKTGSFKIINGDNKVIEYEMGFTNQLINYLGSDDNNPIMFEEYVKDGCEFFIDGTYIKKIEHEKTN